MEEKKIAKIRKNNIKLYPIYKMIRIRLDILLWSKSSIFNTSKKYITSRYHIIKFILFTILYNIWSIK